MKFVYWFIILVVGFGISIIFLENYAFGDSFTFDQGTWNHIPTICYNPIVESYKNYTLHSQLKTLSEWKNKLESKTNNNGWGYLLKIRSQSCDITINFVDKISREDDVSGIAYCSFDGTHTKDCDLMIVKKYIKYGLMLGTLKHELGHALGLSHREPCNGSDFAKIVVTNDVMIYQAGKFRWITEQDLDALIHLYGTDGFNLPNTKNKEYVITPCQTK